VIVASFEAVAEAWPTGMFVVVGLFGLAIGSFLNVVVARVPAGRSLVHPGSACPGCSAPLAWYDNIPVLSYLVLRGRCRTCAMHISWRYPIVEAITAILLVLAYVALGPSADFLVALVLLPALVAMTAIDLQHQMIPDAITLPGIAVGFLMNLGLGRLSWLDCVIGIVIGGGVFFVIILLSRGGMGGGDLKLGAMLGAFLGWKALLFALFVAIVLGGVIGATLLITGVRGRKDPIPFGPFLAAGGAMALVWGEPAFAWWLSGFGFAG
jgi:leader peptidase (prepilin peptidase)/N-methyltransferase